MPWATFPTAGTVRPTTRARCIGCLMLLIVARLISSIGCGSRSPTHGSAGGSGSSLGSSLLSVAVISMPETPSMAAWCTLLTRPNEPSGTPFTSSMPRTT